MNLFLYLMLSYMLLIFMFPIYKSSYKIWVKYLWNYPVEFLEHNSHEIFFSLYTNNDSKKNASLLEKQRWNPRTPSSPDL